MLPHAKDAIQTAAKTILEAGDRDKQVEKYLMANHASDTELSFAKTLLHDTQYTKLEKASFEQAQQYVISQAAQVKLNDAELANVLNALQSTASAPRGEPNGIQCGNYRS